MSDYPVTVMHSTLAEPPRRLGRALFAALALLGTVALAGCSSNAQNTTQAPPPPAVEVEEVTPKDVPVFAEYPAQTYARDLVEIRGRVDGYVDKWLFRPGQQVKAGEALYILDTRPYRAQVKQAQGNLNQANADLTFAAKQVSLIQAEANFAAAQSNLIKAQQDYERFKPLVEQDAASRQDLDAATAALRAAESNLRANEASVKQARLSTDTQIQSAEGRVETQKGALDTASLNLEYGTIRAPISGLVGDTQVPVGGLVTTNAAQPLTTIVPLDPIWVRFKLSESQYLVYQHLRETGDKKGPPLDLLLADGSKFPHVGRIENALNQVDPRTGTLEVQARFPNPEKSLLPGQFGRIRFVAEQRQNAIVVPQRAVQQTQNIMSVYTVGPDNKVQTHAVKTGARSGDDWIIEQGLKPGDRVIVEGLLTIRPGVVVRPSPFKRPVSKESGESPAPKPANAG